MKKDIKNICFVIQNQTLKGGEERMCAIVSDIYAQYGYNVFIVSLSAHKNTPMFYPINERIQHRSLLSRFAERCIDRFLPFIHYLPYKYRHFLKQKEIDVVIDVDSRLAPLTLEAIEGLGIKHIVWDHFCYTHAKERYPQILPLYNQVDKVVFLTKEDVSAYESVGIKSEKIKQIYNPSPIEMDEFTSHTQHTVLAMGRLEWQKGFDKLLKAWRIVCDNNSDWELEIVGNGSLETELKQLADELHLRNVSFIPSTRTPEIYYKRASLYVLSSRYEGFPLVLLEALNMSLPVVAFDCPNGPKEIIKNGVNGLLVAYGDSRELAQSLLELMNDDKVREEMSHNCLPSVSPFKYERIEKQWLDLIKELQ